MQRLARIIDLLNERLGRLVAWGALAMVLAQALVVLLRYVFAIGSIPLQESIWYLHGMLFMLGAGYTLLLDGHVRIDIFQGLREGQSLNRRVGRADLPAAALYDRDRLQLALRRGFLAGRRGLKRVGGPAPSVSLEKRDPPLLRAARLARPLAPGQSAPGADRIRRCRPAPG